MLALCSLAELLVMGLQQNFFLGHQLPTMESQEAEDAGASGMGPQSRAIM